MAHSEPHTIVIKVWHNAAWHHVKFVPQTSDILRKLWHENPNEYYNPTPTEWDTLSQWEVK